MRLYLDSSAIIKRVLLEEHAHPLADVLRRHQQAEHELVTSVLGRIEVSRSIRSRLEDIPPREVFDAIDTSLSGVVEFAITEQVISIGERLGPVSLRSLDAIHLATATYLDADLIVAYDRRLLTAAAELGFRTLSPGLD